VIFFSSQVSRADNANHKPSKSAVIGVLNPRANNEIPAAGISLAENGEGCRIEAVWIDLAFDSVDFSPAADDKIHFSSRLVPPMIEPFSTRLRPQGIQDQVLPKETAVIVPDIFPSTDVGHETGVEPVDFGPLYKLPPSPP